MGDGLTNAILLYDAMPSAGFGHRRRVEAIATELTVRGCATQLRPVDEVDIPTADVVVVDSYVRRADDESWFRADVVAAIDDLDRDLAVDLVVDPSPGATVDPHRRAHEVLAGPAYALVGPGLPAAWSAASESVHGILVTFGGHDEEGAAMRVGENIAAALPRVDVAATARAGGPSSKVVRTVHATGGLGDELANADLVVCAGGVTLLEALRMGRPTVVVITAENQRRAAEHVAAQGAAVLSPMGEVATVAVSLVADRERRADLAAHARGLVDGRGPGRVADELLATFRRRL